MDVYGRELPAPDESDAASGALFRLIDLAGRSARLVVMQGQHEPLTLA